MKLAYIAFRIREHGIAARVNAQGTAVIVESANAIQLVATWSDARLLLGY